jgi:murein L,D-transpeptidase YafK
MSRLGKGLSYPRRFLLKTWSGKIQRTLMKLPILFMCLALAVAASHAATPVQAPVTFILVEKAKRTLSLYSGKKLVKSYRIALGGNPEGHKEQEGDSRTPEGRYIIDAKNPNSSFHLSLHISYPRKQDLAAAKRRGVSPGGAIMIHGTPGSLGTLNAMGFYPDWTAGCIAVANEHIEEIYAKVKNGTPILIKP